MYAIESAPSIASAVAHVTSRDISSALPGRSDRMNTRWMPTPSANITGPINRMERNGSIPRRVNSE